MTANTAWAMSGGSGGLAMGIPQLFFDETEGMTGLIKRLGTNCGRTGERTGLLHAHRKNAWAKNWKSG